MTFPRKIGLALVAVAALATLAHYQGWALPTLRWFYSFEADPELVRERPGFKRQAEVVGLVFSGVMALIGLVLLARGGAYQWNPLTLRKLQRFRSIRRGYNAFRLLLVLVVLAMLDQALVGKRALAVQYEGRWSFPAFEDRIYSEDDFGGEGRQEVDFRALKERLAEEGSGRVLLPPVPWDPVFDSEEKLVRTLPVIDGLIHGADGREPYDGFAVRQQRDDESLKVRDGRVRDGKLEGPGMAYGLDGEPIGREVWDDGELVEDGVPEGVERPEAGEWVREIYPPIPPNLEQRHFLGTDSKGWDVLAQLFGGLQVVFKASLLFLLLTYGIGITIGLLMGWFGGNFDIVMQRLMEVLSNVPFLLVVMIISNNIGRENITLGAVILVFGIFSWIGVAIYLRTATFREKARDYAASARVVGAGTGRILFRHILPNAVSTIVTLVPFSVASVVTSLTALDFLGFGVPDRYPSWGRLLNEGVNNLESPWIVTSVFVMMVLLLMLITFVGEAVREAFDPKKFTTYQ